MKKPDLQKLKMSWSARVRDKVNLQKIALSKFIENWFWGRSRLKMSPCELVFKLSITWQTKAIFILSKIKKGYNIKRYWQIKRLISEKKFQTNLTKLITSADGISFRMTFQFPSSNRKLSIWKKVTIIKVKFDRLG